LSTWPAGSGREREVHVVVSQIVWNKMATQRGLANDWKILQNSELTPTQQNDFNEQLEINVVSSTGHVACRILMKNV